MEQLKVIPEQVTPWLQLFVAGVSATGGAIWLRRTVRQAFLNAVNVAVGPLQASVSRIEIEQKEASALAIRTARDRKREVDHQFVEVKSQIKMLEVRVAKAQESV